MREVWPKEVDILETLLARATVWIVLAAAHDDPIVWMVWRLAIFVALDPVSVKLGEGVSLAYEIVAPSHRLHSQPSRGR